MLSETFWANEPGIQLWVEFEGPSTVLKIVKAPENKVLATATLAPHRAERLADIMPRIVK